MISALINRFAEVYSCNDKFYLATKNGETKNALGGIKDLYDYKAPKQKINHHDFERHLLGQCYLTLSPIKSDNTCCWGAIDVDNYDINFINDIRARAKNTPLIPNISASGGLHLYLHSREFISAELMRKTLNYLAKKLGLNKIEIFPKQDKLNGQGVGNGIKLICHNINEQQLLKHLDLIDSKAQDTDYFHSFEDQTGEEPEELEESRVDTNNLKEIISNIKKKKIHSRGGDVDNHIVDFVSVAAGINFTNNDIFKKLQPIKPEIMLGGNAQKHKTFENYIKTRIRNFRKTFNVIDPDVARKQFLNNIIYLKDTTNFFDKTTNKIYKKEAITMAYSQKLAVADAVKFWKSSRESILCENFKYRPKQYDPNNPVIKVDNLSYINKYKPYDLVPEQGDISLFLKLISHVIPDEKIKESLLDFICYHYQYPGEKIKFAWILQSNEFQIGKGSIWYAIKNTLGDNVKKVDIEESLDKAKQFLKDRQLVLIDEMKSRGNWEEREEVLNTFKLFITEEEHGSRILYTDYETIKDSCTNFMFFTNFDDAVVLPQNETRYIVYCSTATRLENEFYEKYYNWVESDPGKKALLHFFKTRKISDSFKPKSIAPKIGSLNTMSLAGEKTLDQKLRSLFDQGLPPFEYERRVISLTWLSGWCEKNKIKISRPVDLAKFLQKIGGINKGQIKVNYNDITAKITMYVIRHHEQMKDYTHAQIGKEFLDKYVDDKLVQSLCVHMFGEKEIK